LFAANAADQLFGSVAKGLPRPDHKIGSQQGFRLKIQPLPQVDAKGTDSHERGDPERLSRMAARNWAKAQLYREDVLAERRAQFYAHARQAAKEWLARTASDRP
jgi:hypothetical protein